MRYVKAFWDEPFVGPAAPFGASWWFFEVGDDAFPIRQAIRFEDGTLLLYDAEHLDDEYGGLGDQPLDFAEGPYESIEPVEFDSIWQRGRARNRRS